MTAMSPVAADDPRMIAWNAYSATEDYANTKRWAVHEDFTEGSLWAAFIAGFAAALASLKERQLTPEEAQSLLNNIGSLAVSHPHFQIASRNILAKLRLLSTSDSEQNKE